MKHAFPIAHRLACVLLCVTNGALAQEEEPPPAAAPPPCLKVRTEARYIIGYDHLVHLENTCEATAHCSVATNVNPEQRHLTLRPGEKETVLTFRGSPARTFQAKVKCEMDS